MTEENIFTGHGKKRCRPICYEEDSRRNTSGSVSFGHCARHVRADGAGNDMRNEDGSTYVRTVLNADIYVYRKDGDRFSKKRIRENEIKELGNQTAPEETMKWAISKQVNIMENRPVIN